jgi:5-methylcytosine-specific restriction enzyme A
MLDLRDKPIRRWYSHRRWQAQRLAQLRKQPLCERCLSRGRVQAATVAHHRVPHKGDLALFWDTHNLASSCASCHDVDEQRIEHGGKARPALDAHGWPEK